MLLKVAIDDQLSDLVDICILIALVIGKRVSYKAVLNGNSYIGAGGIIG